MLFESNHSLLEDEFYMSGGASLSFPIHIHRSFEYFFQVSGQTEIRIDDKVYLLRAGDGVLIFPFQTHSYRNIESGEYKVYIFSADMVSTFKKKVSHSLPADNTFRFDCSDEPYPDNAFLQKALAYKICGNFDKDRTYVNRGTHISDNVLVSLLTFVEDNFCNDCSLLDASRAIGYDYAYISKYFKRKINIPFKKYVNILRVQKAAQLLNTTSCSTSEIIGECGFQCMRTFNRAFSDVMGISPSEYRKKLSHSQSNV